MVKITCVEKGSYADKAGIKSGDALVSINNNIINDVLDYRFYLAEENVVLSCVSGDEEYNVNVSKKQYDDIGLGFETPLMDKKHTCKNGCIFCFIDQNPKGLRESLYFKDDDSRLSFLHGNYITLTNMSDEDVARIIKMRISPINVSVHTTNPELRVKMMKNKRAGEVLRYLKDFKAAGLSMCAQIVLCKGVNDGEELVRSLNELSELAPELLSVAVVPAGLTKYRENLYPLEDFSPKEAGKIIDIIDSFAKKYKKNHGTRLVYPADEFFLKSERKIPDSDYYEDFSQLENGVGMIRSFLDEVETCYDGIKDFAKNFKAERKVSVATGVASYSMVCRIAKKIEKLLPRVTVNVYKIINFFFGESITVSGLLTGKDIYEQLRSVELGDALLIPKNALRAGEEVFLCGMTVSELSEKLGVPVKISGDDGVDFVDAVLNF